MTRNYLQYSVGDIVSLNKDITIGDIVVKEGSNGKIVHARNRVSVEVWFFTIPSVIKELTPNDRVFRGIVLEVSTEHLFVNYIHNKHKDISIPFENALSIPFVKKDVLLKEKELEIVTERKNSTFPSSIKLSSNFVTVETIIETIEHTFSEYVSNLNYEENTDNCTKDDFPRVLCDGSLDIYIEKQEEIAEGFRKVTKLNNEFKGGLISIYD